MGKRHKIVMQLEHHLKTKCFSRYQHDFFVENPHRPASQVTF